jgi:NAD(P)-dependent dehydrogenase (short-subunit alcohol dehydrogenase family)
MTDLTGKVCLITGATSGIGLAAARHIAAHGGTVVLAGRHATTCTTAAASAGAYSRVGAAAVDWLAADLAVQDEVRALAAEFQGRYDRLDVLVNNAGTIVRNRTLTPEGVELTLAVNHLAPFLLTNLLRDLLAGSAPARVVTVTSVAHERGRLDFGDMRMDRGYLPFRAYARSKLANLLFTYELARRLEGSGVTANAVNPGLVRTGLGRGNGPLRDLAWQLTHLRYRSVSLTADQGADSVSYLAGSPAVEALSGKYFFERRPVDSSPASRDAAVAAQLWSLSEVWTGLALTTDPSDNRIRGSTSTKGWK